MQLLFEFSEEGNTKCLGLLKGTVKRFKGDLKIPEMGWNNVTQTNPKSSLLKGINKESYFYFVNSFYCDSSEKDIITGTTDYGINFVSIIEKDNIYATQFHSEKSGETGLQLLKNFAGVCK
jgi:glutamine amidotransferase